MRSKNRELYDSHKIERRGSVRMRAFRRRSGRKVLAGLLLASLLMVSGCGNSDMDPLCPPVDVSYTGQERATAVVERGDLTPVFQADIELSGFEEMNYSITEGKLAEIEMLYKAKFDEVLVSEGDRVSEGDTLLTFTSEVLEKKSKEWSSSKTNASLRREHYRNLQALDENYDYYDEIVDLNDEITLADEYAADVAETYNNMNLVATNSGVVTFIHDSVKDGFIVTGSPIIKVSSDDGYYIYDRSEKPNMDKNKARFSADIDFHVGDRFDGKYALSEYVVEVIPDPTGKTVSTATDASSSDDTETASAGDSSSSGELITGDKVYFKIVGDDAIKDKAMTISKELPVLKNVCYVDRRAIIVYDDKTYVYKEMEDGTIRVMEVDVDQMVGLYAVINSGLEEGDTVTIPD